MPRNQLGMVSNVTRTAHAKAAIATSARMTSLDLGAAMAAVEKEANVRTSKQLVALARAFGANAVNGAQTAEINARIVAKAQTATLQSYDSYRRRGGPSGYRSNSDEVHPRYSGGVLRDVIAAKSFIRSDSQSMGFINVRELDTRALQWKRLNFGAGAAGAASPGSRPFPVRVSNLIIADLGLSEGPRPSFRLPEGYFIGGGEGGGGAFYLAGTGPTPKAPTTGGWTPTRGIRAEHFLDNGIAVIAGELWPHYQQLLITMSREGLVNVRGSNSTTHNKPVPKPSNPRL